MDETTILRELTAKKKPIVDPFYCPLCGYHIVLDLDGHFLPCLLRHAITVQFDPRA